MNLLEWVKHYPEWCDICGISGGIVQLRNSPEWVDRVSDCAEALSYIHLVEDCCRLACGDKWEDLLLVIIEDIPCEMLDITSHELQSFLFFLSNRFAKKTGYVIEKKT